jgi:hypothetical protein
MMITALVPAYRLYNPTLSFTFPSITTATGAQWLDALAYRVLWTRCGVEQKYFSSTRAVQAVNAAVHELKGLIGA